MLTHLTKKPGEFKARCGLGREVKTHLATPEQKAEAARLELPRRHLGINSAGRDVWSWTFPVHAGVFETTDSAEYQAHLDEFHDGGRLKLTNPTAVKARKPRQVPVTAFNDRDHATLTCPGCGLVGEVRGDYYGSTASERWWAEHLEGCALAMAGAAS